MKIIATTVPAGWTGNELRVSLAFGFKPDDGQTELSPDDLKLVAMWPETLRRLFISGAWTFLLDEKLAIHVQTIDLSPLDSHAWETLIWTETERLALQNRGGSSTLAVNPHKDRVPLAVTTIHTAELHSLLIGHYSKAMTRRANHLLSKGIIGPTGDWVFDEAIASKHANALLLEPMREVVDSLNWYASDATGIPLKRDGGTLNAINRELNEKIKSFSASQTKAAKGLQGRNLLRMEPDPSVALSDEAKAAVQFLAGAAVEEHRVKSQTGHHYFWEAAIFHRRIPKSAPMPNDGTSHDTPDPARELDFFERVAMVRNYPALLRPLGLTMDMTISAKGMPETGVIAINLHPDLYPDLKQWVSVKTQFVCDRPVFRAADRDSEPWLRNGFLTIDREDQFEFIALDTDSASQKQLDAAKAAAQTQGSVVTTTPNYPFAITGLNSIASTLGVTMTGSENLVDFLKSCGTSADIDRELTRLGIEENSDEPNAPKVDDSRAWVELTFNFHLEFKIGGTGTVKTTEQITARAIRAQSALVGIQWQLLSDPPYQDPVSTDDPSPRNGGLALIWKTRHTRLRKALSVKSDDVQYADQLVLGFAPQVWLANPNRPREGQWLSMTLRQENFTLTPRFDGVRSAVLRLPTARTADGSNDDQVDLHVGPTLFSWNNWTLGADRPRYPSFTKHSFNDATALLARLRRDSNHLLTASQTSTSEEDDGSILAAHFTKLLQNRDLWQDPTISRSLTKEQTQLIPKDPYHLAWFNRRALERAFPEQVREEVAGFAPGMVLVDSQVAPSEIRKPPTGRWNLDVMTEAPPNGVAPMRFHPVREETMVTGEYLFKVPTVDIAGNIAQEPEEIVSKKVGYGRFDPIKAPAILLDDLPSNSKPLRRGVHRMVVSEEYGNDTRWIVPARDTEELAELHGYLDVDNISDVGSFDAVALTEEGDFPTVSSEDVELPKLGAAASKKAPGELSPIRLKPSESGDRVIPYFPDPLAKAVAWRLEFLESSTSSPSITRWLSGQLIGFYESSNWPKANPFQVILKRGDGLKPTVDWSSFFRELTVKLPPGLTARLHLSSSLEERKMLDVFVLWQKNPLKMYVGAGEFLPTFTGAETIELIHAVTSPVAQPRIDSIHPPASRERNVIMFAREQGKTMVDLEFDVAAEVQSSGKLRFLARWDGPSSVEQGLALRLRGRADIGEIHLETWLGGMGKENKRHLPKLPFVRLQHTLPDTKFRIVEYKVAATTRYAEHFAIDPSKPLPQEESAEVPVALLNSAIPPAPSFAYVVPTFDWTTSCTKENPRKFLSKRTALIRLFLSPEWDLTGDDEMVGATLWAGGEPQTEEEAHLIRASTTCWGLDPIRAFSWFATRGPSDANFEEYALFAPGEIVNLQSLVAMLNDDSSDDPTLTELKKGFSDKTHESLSNYDETDVDHGFILKTLIAKEFARFLAENAANEAWLNRAKRNRLQEAFPGCLLPSQLFEADGRFVHANLPSNANGTIGPIVKVIPYRPQFDPERQLWFCDIKLTGVPSAYAFVRVALCRFQPHSITGCNVSPVALADFCQIAPTRTLSVWRDPTNALQLRVQVIAGGEAGEEDTQITIGVFMQDTSRGWVEDPDIKWASEALAPGAITDLGFLLLSGTLTWARRTGARRIFVKEESPSQPNGGGFESCPYMDILDL